MTGGPRGPELNLKGETHNFFVKTFNTAHAILICDCDGAGHYCPEDYGHQDEEQGDRGPHHVPAGVERVGSVEIGGDV